MIWGLGSVESVREPNLINRLNVIIWNTHQFLNLSTTNIVHWYYQDKFVSLRNMIYSLVEMLRSCFLKFFIQLNKGVHNIHLSFFILLKILKLLNITKIHLHSNNKLAITLSAHINNCFLLFRITNKSTVLSIYLWIQIASTITRCTKLVIFLLK